MKNSPAPQFPPPCGCENHLSRRGLWGRCDDHNARLALVRRDFGRSFRPGKTIK